MQDWMRALPPDERELLDRARAWSAVASPAELSGELLKHLARDAGIDFATAVAYDRLRQSARHGAAIRALERIDPGVETSGDRAGTIAVVPGAFHQDRYRQTGADGQVVLEEARRLGFATSVAPTRSFGSLEENSAIICDWLGTGLSEPIVLVSLSKGTAEVKVTLRSTAGQEALARVSAWVSLSGVWWGSPLVGWLLERRLRSLLVRLLLRWRGHDFRVIKQLAHGPDSPLAFAAPLPEHLQLLHVVGFPLQRHLSSPLAERGHRRLAPLGPNDAAGLLADACRLPGSVYPVWGADHYLRPAGADNRQLVRRILLWLDRLPVRDAVGTTGVPA